MTSRTSPTLPHLTYFMLLSMIGPVAMNIIVPALPLMAESLNASKSIIQMSLSLFLVMMGLGQLISGALADHYGRKPVLITGFILHIVGCLIALAAPSAIILLLGRVMQALGASTGVILARTLILELYGNDKAGGKMAYLSFGVAVSQALVPLIGGFLSVITGWRSLFILPIVLVGTTWLITALRLPTEARVQNGSFSMRDTFSAFSVLVKTPNYLKYIFSSSCISAGYFLFLGAAPYIVVNHLNGTAADFGSWFVLVAAGFMAGSFISANLSASLGISRMVVFGLIISMTGVMIILGSLLLDKVIYLTLFLPFALYTFGRGWAQPNNQAAAIATSPDARATASGLMGFIQITCGSLAAQAAPAVLSLGLFWVFASIIGLLVLSLLFFLSTRQK